MRLFECYENVHLEILREGLISPSSWIEEIEWDEDTETVTWTLLSGRMYEISGIDEDTFAEWELAKSPGKFWWANIAGLYDTRRIA